MAADAIAGNTGNERVGCREDGIRCVDKPAEHPVMSGCSLRNHRAPSHLDVVLTECNEAQILAVAGWMREPYVGFELAELLHCQPWT